MAAQIAAWVRSAGWPAIAAATATVAQWSSLPNLAAVVACGKPLAGAASAAVAARSGTRIPVVEPTVTPWHYPVWRLETERTVSVNTVAAGGNAHLLAQMD